MIANATTPATTEQTIRKISQSTQTDCSTSSLNVQVLLANPLPTFPTVQKGETLVAPERHQTLRRTRAIEDLITASKSQGSVTKENIPLAHLAADKNWLSSTVKKPRQQLLKSLSAKWHLIESDDINLFKENITNSTKIENIENILKQITKKQ